MDDDDAFHQETLVLLKWIGVVVQEERKLQKMSRKDLARKSGLSLPEIALIEQGKKNLLFETPRQISKVEIELRAHRAGNLPL